MHPISRLVSTSGSRRLLMETLAGHLALLQATYPRKAAAPVAKRARACVNIALREPATRARAA